MSNIRLFYRESLSLNLTATLDKSQSHYVSKVMRIKENEVFLYSIVVESGRQKY
jgi:16S rRNA (uracil1498-N3)-methyltransferase